MSTAFKKSLGGYDATMIVAGSMIGSGIFIVSADIVRTVGSGTNLLLCWLLAAIMTIFAALSYGELAGMFPNVGGQYVYLKKAFNPLIAFLYGWSFFGVIECGTIAAVAVAFAKFTAYFFPVVSENNIIVNWGMIKISAAQLLGVAMIVLLTLFNLFGVKNAKWIQAIFTSTKIMALLLLLIAGFGWGMNTEILQANFVTKNSASLTDTLSGFALVVALGSAMVGALFSSDAWNSVTFIAAEIRKPHKNIPRSLLFGTAIVTLLYIAINVVYLSVLSLDEIKNAELDRVGVAAAVKLAGGIGAAVMALLIMISTFGCNNGLILSGARLYYTMAQDGLFFKKAGTLNKHGVPQTALILQAFWASLLCLSGSYGALLDYTIFAALLFYILTIAGIFVLRKKEPLLPRPYKAWGYPIIPMLYIIMATAIALILLFYKSENTIPGLLIVLSGVPVYYIFSRKIEKTA